MDKQSAVYLLIVFIVFVLALGGIYYAYLINSEVVIDLKFTSSPVASKPKPSKQAKQASLSLESLQQSYKTGETILVKVMLDTKNNFVDGVDVVLKYPTLYLRPEPAESLIDSPGVFDNILGLKIDQEKEEIRFSAITQPGKGFKGQGQVATLNFLSLQPGQAKIEFDFTPGSTIDSNVSAFEEANDILGQVNNLDLIIK